MAIADTFDRANSTTTINPASDSGTWTIDAMSGTTPVYGISSNQAILVSGGNTGARARRNTNQVDADVTITVNFTSFSRTHIWVAYNPATDTGYYYQPWGPAGFTGFSKWTSGSAVAVGAVMATAAAGAVVRVTYNYSTGVLEAFYGGTSQGTRTDGTPITAAGNSWVGFDSISANSSTGESWDNFSAVSSAGPTVTYRSPQLSVVRQAVRRASVI